MLPRSNIQNHMFACCLFPFEWMHTSDYSVLQNKPQFNRPWTESIRLRILSIWIMNYRSQRPTENISIYKSRLFVLIAWSIKRMSLLRQCQSIRIFQTIIHVVDQMSNIWVYLIVFAIESQSQQPPGAGTIYYTPTLFKLANYISIVVIFMYKNTEPEWIYSMRQYIVFECNISILQLSFVRLFVHYIKWINFNKILHFYETIAL